MKNLGDVDVQKLPKLKVFSLGIFWGFFDDINKMRALNDKFLDEARCRTHFKKFWMEEGRSKYQIPLNRGGDRGGEIFHQCQWFVVLLFFH